MRKTLLLFGVIALLLIGCSQNDIPVIPDNPTEASVPTRHVSMQTAKERLREILPEMTVQTRSSFTIDDGIAFNNHRQPLTRAQEDEALYYYFPIDNGNQYAIMSARSELPQLLALGNGSPDVETLDELIPDVKDWSVATVGYNISVTDSGGTIGGITDPPVVVRGNPVFIPIAVGVPDTTINNLCPVKWDQNVGFNQFCPDIPDEPGVKTNACCVATAVAQLFANEKCRPSGSANFAIDWELLLSCPDATSMRNNPEALRHIAELLIELGLPENLDVTYHYDGKYLSVASSSDIGRTLKNFGFKNEGKLVDFTQESVINEFKRGYPVIISGRSENARVGHSWILHGYKVAEVPVYVYQGANIIAQWTEYETYFQCNWGCSGMGDGYFHAMGFDPQTGRVHNPEHMPDCPYPMGDLSYHKRVLVGVEK